MKRATTSKSWVRDIHKGEDVTIIRSKKYEEYRILYEMFSLDWW